MSGRIRRLLRTVPKGRVNLGEVARLATDPPPAGAAPSPAQWLARRLLARQLSGAEPARCLALGPGSLLSAATLPFSCRMAPLAAEAELAARGAPDWLIVGDALAAEPDPPSALRALAAALLEPRMTRLLLLLPGTALLPGDAGPCPRRWLFTEVSARRLAADVFATAAVRVEAAGNVLVASSELLGLAADRLWDDELRFADPQYPVVVSVRIDPARLDGATTQGPVAAP